MIQIKISSEKIIEACERYLSNDFVPTPDPLDHLGEAFAGQRKKERDDLIALLEHMAQYASQSAFQYLILSEKEFKLIRKYLWT